MLNKCLSITFSVILLVNFSVSSVNATIISEDVYVETTFVNDVSEENQLDLTNITDNAMENDISENINDNSDENMNANPEIDNSDSLDENINEAFEAENNNIDNNDNLLENDVTYNIENIEIMDETIKDNLSEILDDTNLKIDEEIFSEPTEEKLELPRVEEINFLPASFTQSLVSVENPPPFEIVDEGIVQAGNQEQ